MYYPLKVTLDQLNEGHEFITTDGRKFKKLSNKIYSDGSIACIKPSSNPMMIDNKFDKTYLYKDTLIKIEM